MCVAVPADFALLVQFFSFATKYHQGPILLKMLSAIHYLHVQQGHFPYLRPVRTLINSYVNLRSPPIRQAAALDIAMLRKVVSALPTGVCGARDRALLLLGFAAALRPSELVGLDIGQRAPGGTGSVIIEASGMRIVLHRSKSDSQGRGIEKLVIYGCDPCPIAALQEWLDASGIVGGALFAGSAVPVTFVRNAWMLGHSPPSCDSGRWPFSVRQTTPTAATLRSRPLAATRLEQAL